MISREEIENAVSHLPSGKALRPDGFGSVLLVLSRTSGSVAASAVSPLPELQKVTNSGAATFPMPTSEERIKSVYKS